MPLAILGLLIPVALIVVLVRAIQGRSALDRGYAAISLRRFFHYLVLLGLLVIVALGLGGLLAEALSETFPRNSIRLLGAADLPLAVTFAVVGGPLFVVMAVWTRHRIAADPEEKDSLGWSFYLTVSLLVSLAFLMTITARLLDWALADGRFDTRQLGDGLAWAAVWLVHWVIARAAVKPARMQAHLLAGSAAGLGAFVAGVAIALNAALESLYAELFDVVYRNELEDMLREAAALFVVGVLVWSWYWLQHAARADRSVLWNVYVLLIGVLGGLLTVLVAAGGLVATALEWFIGDPGASRAAVHFDLAPGWVTALVIGAAGWLYHRFSLGSGAGYRTEVHRVHDYMISGVGLLAAAGGLAAGVITLLDVATESAAPAGEGFDERLLVAAITLVVIGGPLWVAAWWRLKGRVAAAGRAELDSVSRRIYLLALIGAGAVTAILSLIAFVLTIFTDLFDGNLSTQSVRDAEAAVGVLLAALAVAGYHWTVYRQDRMMDAPEEIVRLREVVLVCSEGDRVAAAIKEDTGARVVTIERDDDVAGSLDPAEVVGALRQVEAERVVLIGQSLGAFEIIPVRDRR